MTRIRWNTAEQSRDWRSLNEAIDLLPYGDVPCQNDPDLFFLEDASSPSASLRAAKLACDGCGVKELCAEYAIKHEPDYGVWGGTTPRERRMLLIERKGEAPNDPR